MLEEEKNRDYNVTGLIPDFFHDVIAYLIPGYTALILFCSNLYIVKSSAVLPIQDINLTIFFVATIVAYVIGRFLERLSYLEIPVKLTPQSGSK